MQDILDLEDVIASQTGATKDWAIPGAGGKKMRLRGATTMELGEICVRYPLVRELVFGGRGLAGLGAELASRFIAESPGAVRALIAACAGRLGDKAIEDGVRGLPDEVLFPLAKECWGLTFPLGVEGRIEAIKRYLEEAGVPLVAAKPAAKAAAKKTR